MARKKSPNALVIFAILVILLVIAMAFAAYFMSKLEKQEVNGPEGKAQMTASQGKASGMHDSGSIQAYFCQVENCTKPLLAMLSSAEKTIHCAFYELNLEEVISLLGAKSAGLDVRLFIDDEYALNLSFERNDNASPYMHNKFCIVDGLKISTGSMNPTFNDAYRNDNNLLVIESAYLARNYEEEFAELWGYGKNEKTRQTEIILGNTTIENYFCPEDECAKQITNEIYSAKSSVYFMAFSFTEEGIATALAAKKNEGIEVRGVFETRTESQYSQYEFLKFQGADVRLDGNKYTMHHKVFIIDNETVVTGSMNPTGSGDSRNDENILIIHNLQIAKWFAEEFARVWGNAKV